MIATIRADITWSGVNKNFVNQSSKKIARSLRDMTGADDVEIIDINSWDEDDENGEEAKRRSK